MFRILAILLLLLFVLPASTAHACSCAWNGFISDLEKKGATVLLASPVGGYSQSSTGHNGKTYQHETPTRFKVWKIYLGEAAKYENIGMSQSTSCATSYPANEVSIIVAYRRNGHLSTGHCTSGQFDRRQLIDYFENGKDTLGRDFCYMQIKEAYDYEIFNGDFTLENTECLVHKSEYDRRFRIKVSSD